MRTVPFVVASFCIAALVVGSCAADTQADNAAKIVGTWTFVKLNGEEPPKGTSGTCEFTKDGKFTLIEGENGGKLSTEGTYKVDGDTLTMTRKEDGNVKEDTLKIKTLTADSLVIDKPNQEDEIEFKKK